MSSVSITQSNIQTALRSFLLAILPSTVEVVEGQDNRVPEPKSADFVVLWPIRDERLETNTDTSADVSFVGSISGNTLTVTAMNFGTVLVGATINGPGVTSNTLITALGSGTGGVGTYTVNNSQTVASQKLSSGAMEMLQPIEVTIQIDIHGPNASDNQRILSTLFRDDYAVQQFANSGFDVSPLYLDGPRQVPFTNDQQQIETKWTFEAHLQANVVVSVPQQYADTLAVGIIEVEGTYPP